MLDYKQCYSTELCTPWCDHKTISIRLIETVHFFTHKQLYIKFCDVFELALSGEDENNSS